MSLTDAPSLHEESMTLRGNGKQMRDIRATVRLIPDRLPGPVVIVCHSFMAFKDWGFFPIVGRALAEAGFVSVTFNFSWNGVPGDGNRIVDFDRFAENNFSRELEDVQRVIDAAGRGLLLPGKMNTDRVALLGHSRGGGIAVLQASRDERIRSLITWSAIAFFDRWSGHQKSLWRAAGSLPLSRDTHRSPLRLGLDLLKDLEDHRDAFDLLSAAKKIHVPWLIVHGRADVTVPAKEAEALYAASNSANASLVLLDGVGHLLHAASPEEDGYRTLDNVLSITTDWLNKSLTEEQQ